MRIPQTGNPELNFIHGDHLGSTSLMTDISGNLVEEADYFPYGETRTEKVSGGTVAAKYKFTGKEEDKETGLYYYGARYYSPVLGRFLTVDPLQLRLHTTLSLLTDPQSLNEYAYARNNPLKYVDPTGEFAVAAQALSNFSLRLAPYANTVISRAGQAVTLASIRSLIMADRL